MRFIIILAFLSGCAASTDPEPEKPNHCDKSIVSTPEGDRLLIQCDRDVPVYPEPCEPQGDGAYICNIYHASDSDCKQFPGICDP